MLDTLLSVGVSESSKKTSAETLIIIIIIIQVNVYIAVIMT